MRHSYTLRVWKSPFASVSVTFQGMDSEENARVWCWFWLIVERRYKYTKPKWWEFWRWGEPKPPQPEVDRWLSQIPESERSY
jgi:hypothetical protein